MEIKIFHQRIEQAFYEEKNYLLCDKLVKKLLEYFPGDEIGLLYTEKLKGINLEKFKKEWQDSQNLGLGKEEELCENIQNILDLCQLGIHNSFRN